MTRPSVPMIILLAVIAALVLGIIINNCNYKWQEDCRKQELAAKVELAKPHPFIDLQEIITFDDKWELVDNPSYVISHSYADGEQLDDNNKPMDYGDVRVSKDSPLEIGDKVLIDFPPIGIIEGVHTVKAKHGRGNWMELIVATAPLASKITGDARIWRRK